MITETNYTNWELFYQLKNIDVFDIIKNQCDKIERLKALEYLDSQIDTFVYHYEKTAFYTDLIAKLQHLKSSIELSSKVEKPNEPKGKLDLTNKEYKQVCIALASLKIKDLLVENKILKYNDNRLLSEIIEKNCITNHSSLKNEIQKQTQKISDRIYSNKIEKYLTSIQHNEPTKYQIIETIYDLLYTYFIENKQVKDNYS